MSKMSIFPASPSSSFKQKVR